MIRRTVAAAAMAAGVGLLVVPGSAQAHTSRVEATCGEGLYAEAFMYDEGVTVTVSIDGNVVDRVTDNGWGARPIRSAIPRWPTPTW